MDIPVELEVKPNVTLTDPPAIDLPWKEMPCPHCKADIKKREVTSSWGPVKTTVCTNCGGEIGQEAR